MITYNGLRKKMDECGIPRMELRKQIGLGGSAFSRILNDENANTSTINVFCEFFKCQPSDLLEWIPDEEAEKIEKQEKLKQQKIAELEKQLEALKNPK